MILLNKKNVKSIVKNLENIQEDNLRSDYVQSCMPTESDVHDCKCPNCGCKDNYKFYCTYRRNITFVINNEVINFRVIVTRIIWNSCDATHALLPYFIVPYKVYSFDAICSIVNDAANSSVLKVAEKLSISYQLIYNFISVFFLFYKNASILNNKNKYLSKLNKISYLKIFSSLCLDNDFRFHHLIFFKWVFLMSKFQNTNYNSVSIGMPQNRYP